jgi:murein DD-endopeptidase MepM/ murein hydrolase activator NlpD
VEARNMADAIPKNTSTTSTLSVGGSVTGTIDASDLSGGLDKDWYRITLTAGHKYHFTGSATASSLGTVAMRVYSDNTTAVSSLADNSLPLDFTPTSSGTYYLAVSAGGVNYTTETGGFQVSLTDEGTVVATYDSTIVPGGNISQSFGATNAWSDIALNPSTIPSGDASALLTHPAVDIVAPLGTEVDAFAGGTVTAVSAGPSDPQWNSLGWYVLVQDSGAQYPTVAGGKDFYTLYLHLNSQPLVTTGQNIASGTKIGEVGTTGNEKGMQSGYGLLHFEIRLFSDLFQPYSQWYLPKTTGPASNIYIFGAQTAAQLLADPQGTGLGYVDPQNFIVEGGSGTTDTVPKDTSTTVTLAVGGMVNGTVDSSDMSGGLDKDWYKVTLTAGHQYEFTGSATASSLGTVAMRVYSDNTTTASGLADNSTPLDFTPTTSGAYYLAVSAGGTAYQTETGGYQISLADLGAVTNSPTMSYGVDYRVYAGTASTGMDLSAISTYNGFGQYAYTGGTAFVATYLGVHSAGYLTSDPDVSAFTSHGLSLVSIYERTPTSVEYFTGSTDGISNADYDAAGSIQAAQKAGQPSGSGAVYFTVDYDPSPGDISAINSYFKEIRAYYNTHGNPYKIGVYAPGSVLTALASDPLVKPDYTWLTSFAWGTEGFSGENISQVYTSPTQSNATASRPYLLIGTSQQAVDLDTAYTQDFGQWGIAQTTPPNMTLKPPYDFSGSGTSGVLFTNTNGQIALWTVQNGVATSSSGLGTLNGGWSLTAAGDFNGDGTTDLLFRHSGGTIAEWQMHNGQAVAAKAVGSTTTDWTIIGTGDLNADGTDDIVFRNTNGAIAQWQVQSGQATAASIVGTTTNDWTLVAIGHLNSSADNQMLFINSDGAVADWDVVNGQATAAHAIGQTSSYWSVVGIGDFTGNGQNDILFRGQGGEIATWLIQNGIVTGSESIGLTTADWQIAGIGDYNGDGASDILFRNTSGALATWEMQNGHVSQVTSVGATTSAWETAPPHTGITLPSWA